ncbi:MAG: hypothetical protein KDA80_14800 [Planctomycetaceae bacterium]|nr:hypothetical protein [Planctomycetaceae bacterium]
MSRFLAYGSLVALFVVCCGHEVFAQGEFQNLLQKVPNSANAIMCIDAEAVHASAMAKANGWDQKHEAAYVDKPFILPPEADRLVVASQLWPNQEFRQAWELGVMSLREPVSMRQVARLEGGYVDEIGGLQAVWTPSDAYFVAFEPQLLGVMHPAERQAVSRWATAASAGKTGRLSSYLESASSVVSESTQIVLALDLQDSIQPHRLQEWLADHSDDQAMTSSWSKVIRSAQGVMLQVRLTNKAEGELRIDFAESTAPLENNAKKLTLNALDRLGIAVDDLEKWNFELQSRSIVMKGDLSESGLRRIFSLLELPTSKFSSVDEQSLSAMDSEAEVIKASQAYFSSVTTLLDDIRKEFETNRDARSGYSAMYMDRYARRIDRLPILNVDEELLAFGAQVGQTMRDASVSQKSSGVQAGVRNSQVYGNYLYNYEGSGYYGVRSTSSVRNQIQREEAAVAKDVRFTNWKEIEDATAEIRQRMTAKYQAQF